MLDFHTASMTDFGASIMSFQHVVGATTSVSQYTSTKRTGFMPTTSVSTPFGWRSIGSIIEGDKVLAQDGQIKVVIDMRKTYNNVSESPDFVPVRPVRIPPQSLGNMTELCVYPDQLLGVPDPIADVARPCETRLVKASDLVGLYGIRQLDHEEMEMSVTLVFQTETVIACAHGGFAICDGQSAVELKTAKSIKAT